MSKRNPIEQAKHIDDQIAKLQEKQQKYIEKAEREIGKHVMKKWGVEDIDEAKRMIDEFDPTGEQQKDMDGEKGSEENEQQAHI